MRKLKWLGLLTVMIVAACGGSDHGGASSNLATFDEVEPNDTIANTNIVPNNVLISAQTQSQDVDDFASIFDTTLNYDILLCPGNAGEQFFFAISAANASQTIALREQAMCSNGVQGIHTTGQVIPFPNNEEKRLTIECDNDAGQGPYTITLRMTTPTGMETPVPTPTATPTVTPTPTVAPTP